jgi:hypothetical protein
MLNYVYGYDQIVSRFVAALIPHCRRGFGPHAKAIGVLDGDGKLIAGIVYHNWDPDAGIIEISGAAVPRKQWLTRETIKRMYSYPFHVCDCQMVVQRTPADDGRLLGMLAAYGYELTPLPRMFGRDRDGVRNQNCEPNGKPSHLNTRMAQISRDRSLYHGSFRPARPVQNLQRLMTALGPKPEKL